MKTKGSSTTMIEQIQGVLNVTIQGTGQSSILKQHGFGSPAMDFFRSKYKTPNFFQFRKFDPKQPQIQEKTSRRVVEIQFQGSDKTWWGFVMKIERQSARDI